MYPAHHLLPNSMILTNIIEVLHQFAIDVFHGANAILHRKLGNISNPFDDGRRNVHPSFVGTSTGLRWDKYWQRSAKRVLSSANSFWSAGNEFSRCSYSLRSSSGPTRRPAGTCRE